MVVLTVFLWLKRIGAYSSFIDILTNYTPLYAQLSGGHYTGSWYEGFLSLIMNSLRLGCNAPWLIAVICGLGFLIKRVELNTFEKRFLALLLILCGVYSLYPVITGQFWVYHWALLQLFLIIVYSFVVFHKSKPLDRFHVYFRIILTVVVLLTGPRPPISPAFVYQITHGRIQQVKYGRVAEIEEFLKENLKPGDTVQPLDWTGGAVHGMLRAKAKLATSFIYDTQFYHHVDNPYIQKLRERFMRELISTQPRFIIEVTAPDKPHVSGPGTNSVFPELCGYISDYYTVFLEKNGYIIYGLVIDKQSQSLNGET